MIPAWLTGKTVASDRVLTAVWLQWQGEHAAAHQLLHSVTTIHQNVVEQRMRQIAELIDQRRCCDDDPQHYADIYGGPKGQGVTWDEYRVVELETLDADLRVEAEAIAQYADWEIAA